MRTSPLRWSCWKHWKTTTLSEHLKILISRWARLGAGFSTEIAGETPDLERLILATAQRAPEMARLFIMAATWLHTYGDLVARHRLRRLAREELAKEHHASLGLLLDIAQRGARSQRFRTILQDLHTDASPRPLFDVERSSDLLAERSERRASAISKRWGRWCEEFELKGDALRPAPWIMENNPTLASRADFRGDLRASVVAALRHDSDAGSSELQLARRAGGSRAQIRNSLECLEITGRVLRVRGVRPKQTIIELREAA